MNIARATLPERRRDVYRRAMGYGILVVITSAFTGCSQEVEGFRKETSEVTGQVFVDGAPVPATEPLMVECHNVAGFDQENPTVSSGLTGEEGKFTINTYAAGDGLPAGDYVLTFMWGKMNLISATYGGPDKLKGKYADKQSSTFKLTVVDGEPNDLGKIELTTK